MTASHYKNICRLCLNIGGPLIPIFYNDTNSIHISDKIIACTIIQVSIDDELPANICSKCSIRLTDAFEFKRQCEYSDSLLRQSRDPSGDPFLGIVPLDSTQCTLNDDPLRKIEKGKCKQNKNNVKVTRNSSLRCIKNAQLEVKNDSSLKHVESEMPKDLYLTTIKKPDTLLTTKIELVKHDNIEDKLKLVLEQTAVDERKKLKEGHAENQHNSVRTNLKNRKMPQNKNRHMNSKINKGACLICNVKFVLMKDLKLHNAENHKKTFACSICMREFHNMVSQINHERAHSKDKNTVCEVCRKHFPNHRNLLRHQKIHSGEMRIPCPVCSKMFAHSGNLKRHLLVHEDIKRFTCKLCMKKFSQASTLKDHVEIYHGMNYQQHLCSICSFSTKRKQILRAHMVAKHSVYTGQTCDSAKDEVGAHIRSQDVQWQTCSVCSKVLGSVRALGMHLKVHSGIKEFLCRHCGKNFTTRTGLIVHERTHTGERPYACPHCTKRFTQPVGLKNHVRTHTGERPYQCQVCPKRFTQQSHLRTHLLTHTGLRQHICDICNKAFTQREGLRYHKMTHTGETPYICKLCGRGFYIPYKLKVHMSKSHGIALLQMEGNKTI